MKIGVFDSGVGGLSVANAIKAALPEHEVLLREDKENLPYGEKTPNQLFALVRPILESMALEGCSVIVVACNTVTTTIIDKLRGIIGVPLVGVEPMIKPACEHTKTKVIGVFATPTTLASKRYAELKGTYAENVRVVEPDCSNWAFMIEHNREDELNLRENIEKSLQAGADVLVLACTHYHWIEDRLRALAQGKAEVLQPEQAIIERLKGVIREL